MQRKYAKTEKLLAETSLKKALSNFGYSDSIADKVWNWYNPPKQ